MIIEPRSSLTYWQPALYVYVSVAKFPLPTETASAPEHANSVNSGLPTAVDSESRSREPTPTRLFEQLPVGSMNIGDSSTEGGHLASYW